MVLISLSAVQLLRCSLIILLFNFYSNALDNGESQECLLP
jgi:hypothetical protein